MRSSFTRKRERERERENSIFALDQVQIDSSTGGTASFCQCNVPYLYNVYFYYSYLSADPWTACGALARDLLSFPPEGTNARESRSSQQCAILAHLLMIYNFISPGAAGGSGRTPHPLHTPSALSACQTPPSLAPTGNVHTVHRQTMSRQVRAAKPRELSNTVAACCVRVY